MRLSYLLPALAALTLSPLVLAQDQIPLSDSFLSTEQLANAGGERHAYQVSSLFSLLELLALLTE